MIDIEKHVRAYLGDRSPVARPSSFDYCFNYFQAFRTSATPQLLADSTNLELSCLHLGYYLASWGMLRGSTLLHNKSSRFLQPTIEVIAAEPTDVWRIDTHRYTDTNIDSLLRISGDIARAISVETGPSRTGRAATPTLVTKVMLGVFGCLPAFDRFFNLGFKKATGRVARLDWSTLVGIRDFYTEHAQAIDASRVRTLDFSSGKPTRTRYTKAKIIDMALVISGGGSGV